MNKTIFSKHFFCWSSCNDKLVQMVVKLALSYDYLKKKNVTPKLTPYP